MHVHAVEMKCASLLVYIQTKFCLEMGLGTRIVCKACGIVVVHGMQLVVHPYFAYFTAHLLANFPHCFRVPTFC